MSPHSLSSTASPPAAAVSASPVPQTTAPQITGPQTTAPQTMAPALWLVRHGESTWNVAGLAQGHNDEAELTERGLRQAAEAAAQFGYRPVRAIYASDLRRAQQTAAAFAAVLGLPVRTDARLRERSLGVLEGTAHQSIGPSATGLGDGLVIDPDTRPAGGESVRDLYLRAAAFCDDLAAGLRHGGGTPPGDVLVIAHGGTVRVLDAYLHGVPVDQMTWRPVDNATIVRIPEFGASLRGGNR
jgi:2,3-bisphosphoglycerate-dependent phosphoglycerate mutase